MKDVLLIGYNEIQFKRHIGNISNNTGDALTLSYNYAYYNDEPIHQNDFYNICMNNKKKEVLDSSSSLNGAIAYLGTFLRKNNVSYDYVNSFHTNKKKLISFLIETDYRVIAITSTLYVDPSPLQEIVELVKEYSKNSIIVIGGQYIYGLMSFQNDIIRKYMHRRIKADAYVVSRGGEISLLKIVNAVKNNQSFDNIDNLVFFDNGQLKQTAVIEEENALENNLPDWTLFKDEKPYFITLRTASSCPFNCSFCEYPIRGGKYRYLSVELIREQLNMIRSIGTVKHVYFCDDSFNIPTGRFKDILRMMIREKYSFTWNCLVRCQFLDEEALELMVLSKCNGISMGIESANDNILKNMNKRVTSEDYYNALELINKYGINCFVSFILGFPGETIETFQETLDFIKIANPSFYRPHVWYASPLAPIMKNKEEFGLRGERYDWSHNTMSASEAMKLYKRMFFEVEESVWCPQYHFDFSGVMHLLARGHSIEQVRKFLIVFNVSVGEKICLNKSIDENTIFSMRDCLIPSDNNKQV